MAIASAGSARHRYRARRLRRRLILILVGMFVLVVLAAVAYLFISSKAASKTVPHVTQSKLSFVARQVVDVNLVATAVGQYAAANDALPMHLSVDPGDGLVLCGSVCDPTLYTVDGFSAYQAANIKMMAYTSGLTAPDQNTMYLVPGAKCGTGGQLGAANSTPRSMVILYAAAVDSSTQPRCVVL